MNDKLFNTVWKDALKSGEQRTAFITRWTQSGQLPDGSASKVAAVWDAAHITIKEIRAATGLTQMQFCERFCIPRSTLQHWELVKEPAPYLKLLLCRAVGLI